jgi:hypothetical protein
LTGARLTPVASIQPDTVGSNTAALVACVQPSPGSSETTIPNEVGQQCEWVCMLFFLLLIISCENLSIGRNPPNSRHGLWDTQKNRQR